MKNVRLKLKKQVCAALKVETKPWSLLNNRDGQRFAQSKEDSSIKAATLWSNHA